MLSCRVSLTACYNHTTLYQPQGEGQVLSGCSIVATRDKAMESERVYVPISSSNAGPISLVAFLLSSEVPQKLSQVTLLHYPRLHQCRRTKVTENTNEVETIQYPHEPHMTRLSLPSDRISLIC